MESQYLHQGGASRYADLMWDAKRRTELVQLVGRDEIHLRFQISKVEFGYLQFRLILEAIALGSLVANPPLFEELQSKWRKRPQSTKRLLQELRSVNPNFYPTPIQIDSHNKHKWHDVDPRSYLTEERFLTLYNIINDQVVHLGKAPWKRSHDHYEKLARDMEKWWGWIHNLLNQHLVYPPDKSQLWLFQMGKGFDKRPTATSFARSTDPGDKRKLLRQMARLIGEKEARREVFGKEECCQASSQEAGKLSPTPTEGASTSIEPNGT